MQLPLLRTIQKQGVFQDYRPRAWMKNSGKTALAQETQLHPIETTSKLKNS
ncbi:MAG TPA: hypothetical protein VK395_10540 [Gemmataceae bacterium]|nr:hypothetical protein [Gemmataceae bacterium]